MRRKLLIQLSKGKSYLLLLLLLLTSWFSAQAQTITWDGIATGLTPNPVTIAGDAAKLRFAFIATGSAISNASFEAVLPAGYVGTAVANGPSMAGGVTYTTSGLNTGTVTVSITGGTLATGKTIDLIVDVKAGCSAVANGNADIKVKSGATVLDTRPVTVVGAYPALRVQSDNPNQSNATIGHVFNFDLKLDVSNGLTANSFKLKLTKTANTTLTDFKLDGVPVTPSTNTATTVEFTFNNINLGSTVKHLTFNASDLYAGTKNLVSSLQYLNGSGGAACGSAITGPVFTFGAPAVSGTPSIAIVSAGWVAESNLNGPIIGTATDVPMDGITTAYFRVRYKNTGTAPTKQIKQLLQVFRSLIYSYANIVEDASKIKYSVDGGTTIQTAIAANVVFSDPSPANNGYRVLKSAYVNKPQRAELAINEVLAANQEVVVYWPVVQGDIYDNTNLTPTAFASNYPFASIQWAFYNISATDQNGASVAAPQNTYGAGAISNPLFSSTPPSLSFRQAGVQSQQVCTILTEFGTIGGNQTTDLYIQLPSWLELDGLPAAAITTSGIAAGYPKEDGVGTNRYVLRASVGDKRNVTVKYKVKTGACSGVNQTGEIYYWLNYNLGGSTPTRPVLKEIGQIRQAVTLLCEADGIVMDDFKPFRISRGLKDSDQNRVPDSNTPALDTEILHDTYLVDDKGKLIVEGTVQGAFGHLYVLLSSTTLDLTLQQISAATISVNGGAAQNVTLTKKTNNQYYLHDARSYVNGSTVKIEIPFTVKTGGVQATVKTELYMAASAVSDPYNPGAARRGKDALFTLLKMYAPNPATDRGNATFTNNAPVANFQLAYMNNYHGNNFIYPFFSKEYRNVGKLKKYNITLPPGYIIPSGTPLTMRYNSSAISNVDAHTNANPSQTTTAVTITPNANGSTLYSYDLTGIFVTAYDPLAIAANKWIYPDEKYYYDFFTTIQATAAAVSSGTITNVAVYTSYADNHATDRSASRAYTVAYTGDKATLALSATSVTAYNKQITLPVLGVSNASASTKNIWLYIKEGGAFTITSASAKPAGGGTVINSEGNGKWIKLPNVPGGITNNYELSFNVSDVPCAGGKVDIYLFTDFAAPFIPNTSVAPVLPDPNNMGDTKTLNFTASTATIAGSIAVSDNVISYQVPYTFTAALSAAGGQGDVYEGQMVITVPKGQKYVAGTAKYIYGGATTNVPAGVNTAINTALGAGSALGTNRTYTFDISDFITADNLSGGGSGAPANKQAIQLTMDFTSECETDLLNTAYAATIAGKSVCGTVATGNGSRVADIKMTYTSNILFSVASSMKTGINAFNEIHKEDTLLLNFEKVFGSGNLTANDHIEIVMHENINIKSGGAIVVSSTEATVDGAPVSISSNTTASGKRTWIVDLPWNELNSLGNGGQGKRFVYKIPLDYNVSDTVSPENKIEVNVLNEIKLHSTCPPQLFPVGSDELGFGLVVGNTNPDTVYIGDVLPLHIISPGFAGSWYDKPVGGTLISASNPHLFAATDNSLLGDTTFYFSAEFGSNNYGRLPYNVNVFIHPTFIRNLDTMAIACKDKETLSIEAIGMELKYQWYYNLTPITGATDTFYVASLPGRYHIIATDSIGEQLSSDTLNLYLNVVPEFTTDLPKKIKECDRWGYTLSVETTGHHLMYQWYRNGIEIPGANARTYYAEGIDSSAFFRVSVKTVCGDSIMSRQCYLSFCDEDESMLLNRQVTLVAPNTVTTDPLSGIYQVQSQTDFEFTIKAIDGYSLKYMNITISDPIWTDQGGVIKEMISESEMKVTVLTITKPLIVTVEGVSPVSNESFEDLSGRAWAYDGKLYIQAAENETVYIYTTMGHLYRRVDAKAGLTALDVAQGVYFVTFSSGYSGKVLVK